MPLAEPATPTARRSRSQFAAAIPGVVAGWGGRDRVPVSVVSGADAGVFAAAIAAAGEHPVRGLIARGMGRSYGDAAQLAAGHVLSTAHLQSVTLDAENGTVRAGAGVTLGALLALTQPAGWVVPVVPGTQHVSVGGAIAADIHGKNHGHDGTFGAHVRALGLLTASGEVLECTPRQHGDALRATIGGMGLTGLVLWAEIALRRLPTGWLSVDTDRVDDLDATLAVLDRPGGPHRVAWLDLLGPTPVRGVVTRATELDAAPDPGSAATTVPGRMRIPPRWPGALLRTTVVRAHNEARFRTAPRQATGVPEPFGPHMFPLDVLDAWPRLYGPGGLVQYQLVVPKGAERVLEQVIGRLRRSAVPCYLAVLKDFGAANDAPLSFPLAGWTLAMDFPGRIDSLWPLLDSFDDLVAAAGGRVYLAKDGRVRAETLAAMYPRLGEWREVRDRLDPDGRWASDLGLRTGLVRRG